MGVVSSRLEDGPTLYLKDKTRFSISSLTITSARAKTNVSIDTSAFPASGVTARRTGAGDSAISFVQNTDTPFAPPFLLALNNDEELIFEFNLVTQQTPSSDPASSSTDTSINGLTFLFAGSTRELDNLVTREFHADPNLHKNSNVELVASDLSTRGLSRVETTWSWRWRPPKQSEDIGGGWKNICTFVEYDARAHRLNTLATFAFWVQNTRRALNSPTGMLALAPVTDALNLPKIRLPSSQSYQSTSGMSDTEVLSDRELPSPTIEMENGVPTAYTYSNTKEMPVVDVSCPRPGEDVAVGEDGPIFRATMKAFESKTGSMKSRMKKVLRKAETAHSAQTLHNESVSSFMEALREASASNANAVQPALEHHFEKIAKQILDYEVQNGKNLQKLIIEPLSRLYNVDIKQVESKKKDFEEESKEFYSYVSRYLGQRSDSLKDKKRAESDTKYQTKRRNFELKRFDYSSFMQDLHGGKKDQEVLSHLTKYADTQAKSYLATAKKIEEMLPQLEALIREVNEATKEYQLQRTEREQQRRNLETGSKLFVEPDTASTMAPMPTGTATSDGGSMEAHLVRSNSANQGSIRLSPSVRPQSGAPLNGASLSHRLSGAPVPGTPVADRFKGIRDLQDQLTPSQAGLNYLQRKEGLVWALSRPGSHIDPRGINKQAWHKFWLVLDQGRLAEYTNWKDKLESHMEPIDLRLASVRESRDSDRRFCFEVITPSYKRVYQATSEDDMSNWIGSINNALQSAYEGRGQPRPFEAPLPSDGKSRSRDIGSILTGKSPLQYHHSHANHSAAQTVANVYRRTTVGGDRRPSYVRTDSNSYSEDPTKLLQEIRARDQGNTWCADCASGIRTEWVSINLGIVLCIECSGIHRSLGTHVSKVRSLTLDTLAFTSDIVEIIMQVGNRLSNQVWEARLDPTSKLTPLGSRDTRLRFITEKYVNRVYVSPSTYHSPDEHLLASVKKNDIVQVLHAIALKANPNTHDKSRNTHVVFLALIAADPVQPGGPSPSVSPRTSSGPQPVKPAASFPVAEMLLQNGGEVPRTLPAFPLSAAAEQFVEQRRPKTGNGVSGGTDGASRGPYTSGSSNMGQAGNGDILTALPSLKMQGSPSGEKERENKLQKRTSAGARFGGGRIGAPF